MTMNFIAAICNPHLLGCGALSLDVCVFLGAVDR